MLSKNDISFLIKSYRKSYLADLQKTYEIYTTNWRKILQKSYEVSKIEPQQCIIDTKFSLAALVETCHDEAASHRMCFTRLQIRARWRRESEAKRGIRPRAALCKGRRHLEEQKYGILKFGRYWRIGVCIFGSCNWSTYVRLHYVITPQLSVLFTVHTNAIDVTIRISIGDLIAGMGAATKTFAPGG